MGGAVLPDTPTQHLLRTRENLNENHDYSTIAHSHTHTHTEATDDVRTSHFAPPFFFFQAVQQPTY